MIQINLSAHDILTKNYSTPQDFIRADVTRFYFFNNAYLMSTQAGIQAAHAQARLAYKYLKNTESNNYLLNNLVDKCFSADETMIILNGGGHVDLQQTLKQLISLSEYLHLPHDFFNESVEALNGAMTSVSSIIPETNYNNNIKDLSKLLFQEINATPKLSESASDVTNFSSISHSELEKTLFNAIEKSKQVTLTTGQMKKLRAACISLIQDNQLEEYVLNSKKTLTLDDLFFVPSSNGTIYILKKEDFYLSNLLSQHGLLRG